jgi:hypothetical protein
VDTVASYLEIIYFWLKCLEEATGIHHPRTQVRQQLITAEEFFRASGWNNAFAYKSQGHGQIFDILLAPAPAHAIVKTLCLGDQSFTQA